MITSLSLACKMYKGCDVNSTLQIFIVFSSVVKLFKIPEFKDMEFLAECISHLALKAIIKFHNHPCVSAIRNAFNPQSFSF